MRFAWIPVLCSIAACSDSPCLPQGPVEVLATGSVGEPAFGATDCYAAERPTIGLNGPQGAIVEGEEIDFLDADISGAVVEDCVVAIEQQLEGQLEDGTPYSGGMFLTAAPDPEFDDLWSTNAGGYVAFNWNGGGCQNAITGTIISIAPAN